MKVLVLISALFAACFAQAQTMDSVDNIVFKIPQNWQVNKQATYTQLTTFSKERFCQVAFYGKQAANADKKASFEKEWSDLVLASFDAATTAAPRMKKTINGYNVLCYGVPAVSRANNLPYYVELNMFDCGNSVQSAMVVSGSQQHMQFFDSSWQSLIAQVKSSGNEGVVANPAFPFSGQWSKAGSSPYGTSPGAVVTNQGYYKYTYDFKPNGDYTMHGESWGGNMNSNDYKTIDENGRYTVLDKQLVIMPAKSKLQHLDGDGKVKKTESIDMSRRTYTWQLYYFEGIQETNLILTPVKEYFQDGGYSSNSLFPKSYLLSDKFKPEWRFPVK